MDEARYRQAENRLWKAVGVEPTERRVRLPRSGLDLRVQEVGEGSPIVFIHGASNAGSSWITLAARLPGFRCLLVDRPGCGLSAPVPAPLEFDDLPRFAESWLVELLDQLGIGSAHVVATSRGGYTALRTAAAHPDRLRRMVLFGWSLGAPAEPVPLIMRLANVRPLGRLMASVPPNERMVRSMLAQVGLQRALEEGRVPQEVIDCFRAVLADTDTMRNELVAGPRMITFRDGLDERVLIPDEVLARVVAPTYLLWGSDDPFGGRSSAEHLAARLPRAELELLAGAGHALWLDDLERAVTVTAGFLGQEVGGPLGAIAPSDPATA